MLTYALEFYRCGECGPSRKELILLSHPCLLNIPHHQPLPIMLETNHQPMITRLKERKEVLCTPTYYAREIPLIIFFLV